MNDDSDGSDTGKNPTRCLLLFYFESHSVDHVLFSFCADGSEGGINIEEAKRRMREADVVDKETYRAQLKRRKQVRIAMNDVTLRRVTVNM